MKKLFDVELYAGHELIIKHNFLKSITKWL